MEWTGPIVIASAAAGVVAGGLATRYAAWAVRRRTDAELLPLSPPAQIAVYGLIAGAAAGAMAGLAVQHAALADILRLGLLLGVLLAAALVDVQCHRIPNETVAAGLLAAAGCALLDGALLHRTITAGAAGGAVFVVRVASRAIMGRPGFGMGDVKLAAVLGAFLGWTAFAVLYLGVVGAALRGVAGWMRGTHRGTSRLAFAPFLAAAVLAYTLAGPSINWMAWARSAALWH